jgi:hypothetical protein
MRRTLSIAIPMLMLMGMPFGHAQTVRINTWYMIASAPQGQETCDVIADKKQLMAILVPAGWSDYQVDSLDWTKHLLLVTATDQFSAPAHIYPSLDGSQVLIRLGPSQQKNSGVFLLVVDGPLGSKGTCAIYDPAPPMQSQNNGGWSQTSTASAASAVEADTTTRTKTGTAAKPQ